MNPRARLALAIGVLAALVLLAWLLWPSATRLRGVPSSVVPAAAATPATQDAARAIDASSAPAAAAGDARSRIEAAPQPEPSAAQTTRWFARGVVRGIPPGDSAPARLRARFHGAFHIEDSVETYVGADGRVDLELTPAMATWLRHVDPDELHLEVEHARTHPHLTRVPFSSATRDGSNPGARVFEFEVELELAAVVTGRVSAPRGPAWLALHAVVGGVVVEEYVDATEGDADGRFTLRARHGGPFLLRAQAPDAAPVAREVDLALGRIEDVGTLDLDAGAAIEGRVVLDGVPVGAGFEVEAFLLARPTGARTLAAPGGRERLLQHEGRIAHDSRSTLTGADGAFRIAGLSQAEHGLWVRSRTDARMRLGGPVRVEQVVRAPAAGVVLTRVPPRLEVRATVQGRAPQPGELEGAGLDLVDEVEGHTIAQLDLSRAEQVYGGIAALPGVAYGLVSRSGRYAETSLSVGVLAEGEAREVVFDLQPGLPPATLRVRLAPPRGDGPRVAQFALLDVTEPDPRSMTWDIREVGPEGRFDFEDLPPGTLRVHVRPNSPWDDLDPPRWLDDAFEIALPPGAVVEHELALREGGRIRVAARDEHGGFVRTPVELHDAGGAKLATEFYCRTPQNLYGCGWCLCEQGINDHPPLVPGRYALTLRAEGFAEEVVPFDVAVGETRMLEVTLRRL